MALSPFDDKRHPPTDTDLRSILGPAYDAWTRLIELVSSRVPPIEEVWGFTSPATGWGLRLRRKDRIVLYMTPNESRFLVSFALGEKAVAATRAEKLPARILAAIDSAPRYAEGRGVRIEVKTVREVAPLVTLAKVKLGL